MIRDMEQSHDKQSKIELITWMQKSHYSTIKPQQPAHVEHKLIRLQSILRGYIVRKSFARPKCKGYFDNTIDIDGLLQNEVVNKVREKAGAFNFSDLD